MAVIAEPLSEALPLGRPGGTAARNSCQPRASRWGARISQCPQLLEAPGDSVSVDINEGSAPPIGESDVDGAAVVNDRLRLQVAPLIEIGGKGFVQRDRRRALFGD
jgi:hypothetical protein